MLIGFIGIPCSGKTTLAAEVFVLLKKMGIVSEFVVEIARQYIATARQRSQEVVLTDEDQEAIMLKQLQTEELLNNPETITISDSSPLNAMMYMSETAKQDPVIQAFARDSLKGYDLLVVCDNDNAFANHDPNRIHGAEARSGLTAERERLISFIKQNRPDLELIFGSKEVWTGSDQSDTFARTLAYRAVDVFFKKAQASK